MMTNDLLFWAIYAISGTVLVVASIMFWLTNPPEQPVAVTKAEPSEGLVSSPEA